MTFWFYLRFALALWAISFITFAIGLGLSTAFLNYSRQIMAACLRVSMFGRFALWLWAAWLGCNENGFWLGTLNIFIVTVIAVFANSVTSVGRSALIEWANH